MAKTLGGAPAVNQLKRLGQALNVAAAGLAGDAAPLPHQSAIQRAFGRHDVGGVKAHVGGPAATSARALGAGAYATGRHVAFARAPDLRTAAHEAAHVIQQRAGVQLQGGVSASGDPFERHADAVADRVVRGGSAQALLDQTPRAPSPVALALQARGGNLQVGVLPRFRAAVPHPVVINLLNAPRADGQAVVRDADHNDSSKVALENALAEWVVAHQALFIGPVREISAKIDAYLLLREQHIQTAVADSLAALTPEASNYGRLAGNAAYPERLQAALGGEGNLHEQLLIQQMFIDKIYKLDAARVAGDLREQFAEHIPQPIAADALKPPEAAIDIGVGSSTYRGGHNDARANAHGNVPRVAVGGLGPRGEGHGAGALERGTDRFTAVETNAFVQAARLLFDMPVSGAGLSGSAADLFNCAKLFGVQDRADYALAAFSFLASAGAHTFHEVMLIAKSAGFNQYQPGNYLSAIPEGRREAVRADLADHDAHLAPPQAQNAPVQAADGRLHGWHDVLTLDGDVAGWADRIKAYLAGRFGVDAAAVTVLALTDGRSGDRVYKVDVARGGDPPDIFKGVFKVFNDPDVADTEIEIGEMMARAGVRTPGHHGVARVETADGHASRSAVLFDRAPGDSPAALIGQIAAAQPDARADLIARLNRAVVAVARQLAILHGKPNAAGPARHVQDADVVNQARAVSPEIKNLHERGLFQTHLMAAEAAGKFTVEEAAQVTVAMNLLVDNALVNPQLRKSKTHGDANAGNFIVDGDSASVIDVNTGVQSLTPAGAGKKPAAADTGRFLESLRTTQPGALTGPELDHLDTIFHAAYNPGGGRFLAPGANQNRVHNIARINAEKAADEGAEVYYRASWVLNQLSHSPNPESDLRLKTRLVALVPTLAGHIALGGGE